MKVLVCVLSLLLCSMSFGKDSPVKNDDGDVYQTVIVGGGIAGMTAAFMLSKKDILILEKWPSVGGRVWDDYYKGFSYARGAEYLGEPWGIMKKIIKKYKLKPIEIISPAICHYNPDVPDFPDVDIWNGYYGIALMHVAEDGFDEKALDTYNRFQSESVELLYEVEDAGELPHWFDLDESVARYDYVTMREWFIDKGFGYTYQSKWNSHARGLYGANMDEVSILMAISELGWEYDGEEDIDMPEEDWNEYELDQYPTETFTFMGGLSEIPDAIANDKKLKGKIKTNSEVTKVEWFNKKLYQVTYKDRVSGEEHSVKTKSVVMATPADIAYQLAGDVMPEKMAEIVKDIEYCEYLTVNMFSEEPIQDFTFELSTPDTFWIISLYDSLWVQKLADPDNPLNDEVFVTTAYIAGYKCDENLVGLSDAEILSRTYGELEQIFPGSTGKILEYKINRFKHGYPLMGLGAYHRITRLNELNMKSKTFRLVGDYMALPTMEAAMSQAAFATKKFKVK